MNVPDWIHSLRCWLSRLVLRGALGRGWLRRKARRLEEAYLRELCREAAGPAAVGPPRRVNAAKGAPLRRLLFIGDCMWEPDELFPELRQIAELHTLDLHPLIAGRHPEHTRRVLVDAVQSFTPPAAAWEPDAVLLYARPSLLSAALFEVVRRRWSAPLLGLNLDDRVQFFGYGVYAAGDDDYGRWAPRFDLNLTSTQAAVEWYHRRGAAARYLPPGFHPRPEHAAVPLPATYRHQCSFVGSWKPERGVIIERLRAGGAPVTIFGRGWPDSQWVAQAADVYRESQLNLGIGYALAGGRITAVKARDIECPGAGGCYLTTWHWELPQLYEVGREILCYRNVEELVEIYHAYARRPDDCRRIAAAARQRCLAEHTWERRFRGVFRELGFSV